MIGLQVGIAFCKRDESGNAVAKARLRFTDYAYRGTLHGLRTQGRHRFDGRALVVGILADSLDELRNQVVPSLQLNVDVAPCTVNAITRAYETVVEHGDQSTDRKQDNK